MPDEPRNGKGKWIALITSALSFLVAVVVSAYVLGQRTGKVHELVEWKTETAPRIEKMQSEGTTSFKFFHEEYLRKQNSQDEYLRDLDRRIRELEQKNPN